jgi:hypothetical protein
MGLSGLSGMSGISGFMGQSGLGPVDPLSIPGLIWMDSTQGITPKEANGGRVQRWTSRNTASYFETMTDARMPLPESVDSRQALYLDGARHLFGDTSIRD